MVESTEDIVANLPNFGKIIDKSYDKANDSGENDKFKTLDIKYANLVTNDMRRQVCSLLSSTPTDFELLHNTTSLPLPVFYIIILELELAGKIVRYAGNKISLIYK